MSSRRSLLWIACYLVLYGVVLGVMVREANFGLAEPLFVLVIFGGGLSSLAWLLTRGREPLPVEAPGTAGIIAYLAVVAAFATWGLDSFPARQPEQDILKTLAKLLVMVAVPLLLFRTRLRWSWSRRDTAVAGAMAAILIAFQCAFGGGPRQIAEANLSAVQIAVAAVLAFAALSIDAGLVEETFFRALLQTRLERATGSSAGGIVLAALLFGLVHSPGLFLRTSLTHEGLGPHPSLLMAIGYSIVILSPTGLFFGVLWTRTRNLLLVAVVHGAGDLIPNLADFARHFHI